MVNSPLTHVQSAMFPTAVRVVLFLIPIARSNDLFTAYDCSDPIDSHFISHQQCHKGKDVINKQAFTIVQKQTVSNLKSYTCSGFKTTEVNVSNIDTLKVTVLWNH